MSAGTLPSPGETSAAICDPILHKAAVAPVRLKPELPIQLEDIINKALEKDRNLRYQHASEMRADLQRLKRDTDSGRAAVHTELAQISQSSAAAVETPPMTVPVAAARSSASAPVVAAQPTTRAGAVI